MRALQPQRHEPCYCVLWMGQGCEGERSLRFISLALLVEQRYLYLLLRELR